MAEAGQIEVRVVLGRGGDRRIPELEVAAQTEQGRPDSSRSRCSG